MKPTNIGLIFLEMKMLLQTFDFPVKLLITMRQKIDRAQVS